MEKKQENLALKEGSKEIAEQASKKSISETLKDGAKNLGKKIIKNPIKSAGAGVIAYSGAKALIDKKKFSEELGETTGGIIKNVVKPVANAFAKGAGNVAGEGAKTFWEVIMTF